MSGLLLDELNGQATEEYSPIRVKDDQTVYPCHLSTPTIPVPLPMGLADSSWASTASELRRVTS